MLARDQEEGRVRGPALELEDLQAVAEVLDAFAQIAFEGGDIKAMGRCDLANRELVGGCGHATNASEKIAPLCDAWGQIASPGSPSRTCWMSRGRSFGPHSLAVWTTR